MSNRSFFAALAVVGLCAAAAFALLRPATVPTVAASEMGAFGFAPGELVPDFDYGSLDDGSGTLESLLEGKRGLVIALRTVECPVSQKYGHRLVELEAKYAEQGIGFAYLDVSSQDGVEDYREDLEVYGFQGPYIGDPEGEIGSILRAEVSTEVFVIDATRTLRYRGAIDDQFGITFSKPVVRNHYLVDALDQMLAGEDVEISQTEASGCYLEMEEQGVPVRQVTYNSRVSRILQDKCVGCHRDGGVAPMALDSYDQVDGFSEMIKFVVDQGTMPPWFATQDHGVFKNDIRLSDRDKRDLMAWIEAGKPVGDESLAPEPRVYPTKWALEREPDAIIALPEPQEIPASGVLDYRYIVVETNFDTDVWIQAAEIRPTSLEQTHHVIAYLYDGELRGIEDYFIGYAPGMPPTDYPDGAAKLLKKGQRLVFEQHYTPNGRPGTDQTELALVFADEPPTREIRTSAVANNGFEIPPHAENHKVVGERTYDRGVTILSMLPHMHLRGSAFKYELIRADGTESVVLDVPNYDFNWQLWYEFTEPLRINPGDKLRGTAWYNNSTSNPWNPDPDATIRFGEQTFEEMMFGFYDYILDPVATETEDGDGAAGAGG